MGTATTPTTAAVPSPLEVPGPVTRVPSLDELYRLTTKDAFKQHSRAVQGQGYGPRVKRGGGMVEIERAAGATQ